MSLFKLSPIGLGSAAVESLPSYLVRLASVHALSPNELRALVLNRYAHDSRCSDEMVRPEYAIPRLIHLLRPTSFNATLVRELEAATSIAGLSATTFLALGREFGRQRRVFRDHVAWCPLCFQEQIQSGQPAYWQLLWGFRDYCTCHLHMCQLVSLCPSCGSRQDSLVMRGSIDACVRCGMQLSTESTAAFSPPHEQHYVEDLVDLVAGISAEPTFVLSQEAARKCVDALFDEVWKREQERRLWEMVPRDDCISIACGDKELTLPVLRRVAYRLGVSLYGILSGRLQPVTKVLDSAWLIDLPANLRPCPRRRRINREEFLKRLVAARKSFQESPPLSRLAVAAATTTGAIEYRFPAFAEEVKSAYQRLVSDRRQRKEEIARTLVFEFLSGSQEMSRKSAQRYVASRSNLPKNLVRRLVSKHVPAAGSIKSAQY